MGLLEMLPKYAGNKKGWPWDEETDPEIYSFEKEYPKISIVTPSFNQGEFIEETIRSILLQNYPGIEYVIIDGGSTDNTIEVVKKYEPWITYWVSEVDKGQSDAINKGFEKCSGDIFNWLNSDDYYSKNALFNIARNFEESEINIVAARSRIFGIKERISEATPVNESLSATVSASRINQPATFFSALVYQNITPLDTSLHCVMDLHLWLRYLVVYGQSGVKQIDDIVVNFREHPHSKTVSKEMDFYKEKYFLLNNLQKKILNRLHLEKDLFEGINIQQEHSCEILKGINDCFLFWFRYFCKNNSKEIANILGELIEPSRLSLKSRMEYFYLKQIYTRIKFKT